MSAFPEVQKIGKSVKGDGDQLHNILETLLIGEPLVNGMDESFPLA